jgi:hypothetical protein
MKLICPKCNKTWNDLEIQNQRCNDCGTSGAYSDYDEQEEEVLMRMAEDPDFAQEILKREKLIKKKNRRAFILYAIIGIISSIVGFNYLHEYSRLWFWGGVFFAMIAHYFFNKYSRKLNDNSDN